MLSIIVDVKTLVYSGLAPNEENNGKDWDRIIIVKNQSKLNNILIIFKSSR